MPSAATSPTCVLLLLLEDTADVRRGRSNAAVERGDQADTGSGELPQRHGAAGHHRGVEFGNDGSYELDAVDICINNLHEKRRCKREAGLEGLIGLLEGFIPIDKVDYRYLTIFYRCRASIDKGSTREAVLAYRAIGLLALNVATSADSSMEILTNTLHLHALVKTLRTLSDTAAKVVAAIDCLAAVIFAHSLK
ncbi:hypothetical protein ACQ4PT_021749 [Festuca glaucescens]